jgi:FkbM family methyltransferase
MSIRHAIKVGLQGRPQLLKTFLYLYHEVRFIISRIALKVKYPGVRVIRYSSEELSAQHLEGFRSQFGQDFFITKNFFHSKYGGIFMDIGCNHPENLNNTYYLERRLGWSGIAFDPIARFVEQWTAQRNATFMPVALGDQEGCREFVEIDNKDGWANMLSAFADRTREESLHYGYRTYEVRVRRASDVLKELDIEKVDFISIDVEGAELGVLSGLDMQRYTPRVILSENNNGLLGSELVRKYLLAQGYYFHARIWISDDVFVRKAP